MHKKRPDRVRVQRQDIQSELVGIMEIFQWDGNYGFMCVL